MKRLMMAAALLALAGPAMAAGGNDWLAYGHDEGGSRHSPLAQITPANVNTLQEVWRFHMNPYAKGAPPGVRAPRNVTSQDTPVEAKGVIYLATPYGRVVALDAAGGKQLWAYQLPVAGDQPAERGVNYWQGDGKSRPEILFGTVRGSLIALDAATGEPVAGFGADGVVNLKTPEIMNGLPNAPYGLSSPGSLYRNLIILGSRVQEAPVKGASGDVRAFDVRTGKLAWTFHSIPQPGEPNTGTWGDDSALQRSGVNVWGMMTVDEKRGIAYLPFGAPTFDRYGGDRPGNNLYSDSLVAVNAATGKYLWHYQIQHHDIWDDDLLAPPTLFDVRRGGKVIPAVMAINKSAIPFILNRVTGEPLFKVTETPVPPSDVEGEQASPTQPIPEKPVQLARNSFALNEVADITPEQHAACQALIANGNFRPSSRFEPLHTDRPLVRFPGAEGGPEWAGGASEPGLGLFIINTNNYSFTEKLVKRPDGSYVATNVDFRDPKTNMYCQTPPWGMLTAVNVATGDIAWQVPLGVSDNAPDGKKDTGRPSNGGPITTGGGLTFIAGTDDSRLRAFDSKTGKEVWTQKLDYSGHATPMTWKGKDGRQYLGIVATGGSFLNSPTGGDSLIVYALPK